MNIISNILYWISTGLLVPVIILLIFFFIRSIILIGSFFGEYMAERRTSAIIDPLVKTLGTDNLESATESLPSGPTVTQAIREIVAQKDNHARIDLILSEYEIAADRNLALPKTMTKMGPILGLMGTLIPMGPALVGLATGDIASMAYNMQVAFATTVVGLVVSAIGFITQHVKERWFVRNLTVMEFVAQLTKDKYHK
ncbi:MAG: MotA/TolQ/ExbB proton channel family protein [Muribaculaceae bacterium]|nr:MotA/TolQ/ExbB proton channel family protein [Muribaculaceae bacterium]